MPRFTTRHFCSKPNAKLSQKLLNPKTIAVFHNRANVTLIKTEK